MCGIKSRSLFLLLSLLLLSPWPSSLAVAQDEPKPSLSEKDLTNLTNNLLTVKIKLQSWENSLTTRENGLTGKELDLNKTEQRINERETDLLSKEETLSEREMSLKERESDLQKKEQIIPSLQASLTNALESSEKLQGKVSHLEFDLGVWRGVAIGASILGVASLIYSVIK